MSISTLLLFFSLSLPPEDSLPEVDNAIYRFMADNNVPGISLAISKDEKIIYSGGMVLQMQRSVKK